MRNLSVEKREIVLEETNGIPRSNLEDPAEINAWLGVLDNYINNLKRGTVYEVAEAMDRQFVTNQDFRLMFLRSVRYDPKAAAEQIIKFLDLKRGLFGQSKLVSKITLEDLTENDIEYLKSGSIQILPERDSAGRKVVLDLAHLRDFDVADIERARFYIFHSLAECDETQRTGITNIALVLASDRKMKKGYTGRMYDMPIFYAVLYACTDNYQHYALSSVAIYRLPVILRPRFRVHYAPSFEKCHEILARVGIPIDLLPSSTDSFPTKECHAKWFEQRCQMEQKLARSLGQSIAGEYAKTDVLFGFRSEHDGNIRFRNIVKSKQESYEEANKGGKTTIAMSVVDHIKLCGGRFLKLDSDDNWQEVPDLEARNKVAHSFRNARRRKIAT